jgi:hypothetical protein
VTGPLWILSPSKVPPSTFLDGMLDRPKRALDGGLKRLYKQEQVEEDVDMVIVHVEPRPAPGMG